MQSSAFISLGLYFVAMLGIGYYSYLKSSDDLSGFLLGGRGLSPSVTALSAGASDMSAWILMGLPGALYFNGLSSAWIGIGLVIGAYANYLFVAARLRIYTEIAGDALTIPEYFERRFNDHRHLLRTLCSVVIVIFFAIYTTSGVVAGGKLFETSFGLSYQTGILITAGVVVAYSAFGGFLAVSSTDFIQGCIMFVALILVPVVVIMQLGGFDATQQQINAINPDLLKLNNVSLLAAVSAASWGLGYFGQPHIIVRFMAIRSASELPIARRIGMSWMVVSLIGSTMVGLAGFAYVEASNAPLQNPETIFIYLSTVLFHPLISGFLLAAILAAIMSTISSQLLVTSSSLTEDFYHTFIKKDAPPHQLVLVGRLSVLSVAILAVLLAQDSTSSILSLVSNAWAGFGAAFGPVVLLSLFWPRMNWQGALAGMLVGAITVLVWAYAPLGSNGQTLSVVMFEIVPGFIASLIAVVAVSLLTPSPDQKVLQSFSDMEDALLK